jgi:hypothetical protein
MKSVLKLSLAVVTVLVASGAQAQAVGPVGSPATLPAAPAQVVGAQYGYAAYTESLSKAGAVSSTIQINGLAALAIYNGMKDIAEAPGAVANTKVKNGANISCTLAMFDQAICAVAFEALASGKFVTAH